MKKLFLFVFAFLIASVPVFAGSFSDVPSDHENHAAIEYLYEEGIVSGYENGEFGPDNMVNRAQAAKIISGGFGLAQKGDYSVEFDDVPSSEWFFPYVMAGKEAGVISGHEDGYFRPADDVNLVETLKMVVLAGEVTVSDEVNEFVFSDVEQDAWYAPHALYARNQNIVWPDEEGNLNADTKMTRGEFSEIIYRMMIVLEEGGPFDIGMTWDYYKSTVLPFKMKVEGSWEVIESDEQVTFFKPDTEYSQFSPERVYPNTGVVTVAVDDNEEGLGSEGYFDNIQGAFSGADYSEFSVDGFPSLEVLYSNERIVDWYVYLDDGRVLAVYTEFGDGDFAYQLQETIKTMLHSLAYQKVSSVDYDSILNDIFEVVLVESEGMDAINTLPDATIIDTDTIGVGTGPIDYYYSTEVDYTFKYERESDVILATEEGETSAF
ncbi:S-layer homology domain-containing protein [Candidatus Peregrinibacteria bacterium]|jgi:hypothetical protein|nr:S-layer homology domain-containing protein [Candidatus Peregrinibacteria bacterium]MBT7736440.1 S-layer homology domain-containing protein [Candidatus Peregrinibacteria bacterium]